MLDRESRDRLKAAFRGAWTKAASDVTTEVRGVRGDYKVVLTAESLDRYFKGQKIASTKIAEMDADTLDLLRKDPEDGINVALDEFVADIRENGLPKEAANAVVDADTGSEITQKQLEKNVQLHPRQDANPGKPTQQQLADAGEHVGTYNVTHEGQLEKETTTFKGVKMDHARAHEDRNEVTQAQLDNAERQATERDENGIEYGGKQTGTITERQIEELLSHHGWEEPRTITEGRDQLQKQDGELARLTASSARELVTEAISALGRVAATKKASPDQVLSVLKQLTSHPNKELHLASVLLKKAQEFDPAAAPEGGLFDSLGEETPDAATEGADKDAALANLEQQQAEGTITPEVFEAAKSAVEQAFAGATEVADTGIPGEATPPAPETAPAIEKPMPAPALASAMLSQLSKLSYPSRAIAGAMFTIGSGLKSSAKIAEAAQQVIKTATAVRQAMRMAIEDTKYFGSAKEDGLYQYSGSISEVDADVTNREAFGKAAFKVAVEQVLQKDASVDPANLAPVSMAVNLSGGIFDITIKDTSVVNTDVIQARAERRRELAKLAQVPAGGMPPAGGMGMGAGATPPGGGMDPAMPPAESLTTPPAAPEAPEEMGDEPTGEPQPPGSICPACGSTDVNVDSGEFTCQKCGAEGEVFVEFEITKWPGTIEESESKGEGEDGEGFELGGEEADAGLEGAGEPGPVNVPVAASVRLTPRTLEKLASMGVKPGTICPNCGSDNCDLLNHAGVCFDCFQEYKVSIAADRKNPHRVVANFQWLPKVASNDCTACSRVKNTFMKALKEYGMNFSEFHALASQDKGKTLVKMAKAGVLRDFHNVIGENIPLEKFAAVQPKFASEKFDAFPRQTCLERLSRRFGEKAVSMAGPCQGKKLAECVCNQLENLGVYTDGIAAKVAKVHMHPDVDERDPTGSCLNEFVKKHNFDIREANLICDCLKAAYATDEDMLIEAAMAQPTKVAQCGACAKKPMPAPATPAPTGAPAAGAPAPAAAPAAGSPSVDPAKPMPENPLDSAVSDEGSEPFGGETTDDLAPADDLGMDGLGDDAAPDTLPEGGMDGMDDLGAPDAGGDMVDVTMTLSRDTAEEVFNALQQVMEGDIDSFNGGAVDDFGSEPAGDDLGSEVDTGDVTDGVVGDDEGSEPPAELATEIGNGEPVDEEGTPEHEAEETPEEEAAEKKEDEVPGTGNDFPGGELSKEGDEPKKESEASFDPMLMKMKKATIRRAEESTTDMIDALLKQAKDDPEKFQYLGLKEKKTESKPVQDDFKDVQKSQTLGKEEPFDKGVTKKPDVPRSEGLLGEEPKEKTVDEKGDMPSVPAGSAAMDGETNKKNTPEKQNRTDGNQGTTTMASAKRYIVKASHSLFQPIFEKVASGSNIVTLNDSVTYEVAMTKDGFVLTAQKSQAGNAGTRQGTEKVSQSVKQVNRVKDLESDPDVGQVSADKTHSLAVDEKKPSEGMSSPETPEAPNQGRLNREHTVDNKLEAPSIPVGGGQNPDYDTNEDYKPEKQNDMLGNVNHGVTADTQVDLRKEATRIAGRMLVAGRIKIDALTDTIEQLSQLTVPLMRQYENDLLKSASDQSQGLTKQASVGIEQALVVQSAASSGDPSEEMKSALMGLFTLERKNREADRFNEENGDYGLLRK